MLRAVVPPLAAGYAVFVAMVLVARRRPVPRPRRQHDPLTAPRTHAIGTTLGGYIAFLAIVLVFHVWLAEERRPTRAPSGVGRSCRRWRSQGRRCRRCSLGETPDATDRTSLGDPVLGEHQRLPIPHIETLRDASGQLHVLLLILAHRHLLGLVREDVGCLEDRVRETRRRRRSRRDQAEARSPCASSMSDRGCASLRGECERVRPIAVRPKRLAPRRDVSALRR